MTVGESRFDSSRGYTAAQQKFRPGQAVRVPDSYGNHYSPKFTVESDKSGRKLPTDADCGYRAAPGAGVKGYSEDDLREPLFNAVPDEEPEEPEEEETAAPEEKKESFFSRFLRRTEEEDLPEEDPENNDGEEEEDERPTPGAQVRPVAGISEDVLRFMSGLRKEYDADQQKLAAKREKSAAKTEPKKAPVSAKKPAPSAKEDEDETDEVVSARDAAPRRRFSLPLDFLKKQKTEENFDLDDEDEYEEELVSEEEDYEENEDLRDPEDYGEDGEEEEFSDESIEESIRRDDRIRIMKYILGALIVILIGVGIFAYFANIKKDTAQTAGVEEVTAQLWTNGIALMRSRVDGTYQKSMLSCCDSSGNGVKDLQIAYTRDLDALDSLLPANPRLNDRLFVDALKAVQEKINVCLMNDALAFSDTSRTAAQKNTDSNKYWNEVVDLVDSLASSTTRGELEAIKKNSSLVYTIQATPTPAPTYDYVVTYAKLQKGSSGADVINLQTRLKELGYLKDAIDGSYGNKTKTAVQLFQQKAGLAVNGIADEETQRLLFSSSAPEAD